MFFMKSFYCCIDVCPSTVFGQQHRWTLQIVCFSRFPDDEAVVVKMLDSLNKTQIGLSLPDEKESVAHYVSASRQRAYITTLKFQLFIPDSPIWLVVCSILNLRPSLVALRVTPASEEGLF